MVKMLDEIFEAVRNLIDPPLEGVIEQLKLMDLRGSIESKKHDTRSVRKATEYFESAKRWVEKNNMSFSSCVVAELQMRGVIKDLYKTGDNPSALAFYREYKAYMQTIWQQREASG